MSYPGPSLRPMTSPPTITEAHLDRACKIAHDAYESAAVARGWLAPSARIPWSEVHGASRAILRASVAAVLSFERAERRNAEPDALF